MKKTGFVIFFLLICKLGFNQTIGPLGDKASAIKRIENIRECTGKILVDGIKSGTGFYVSSNGIILTNWHVVFNERTKIDPDGSITSKFTFVDNKNDSIPLKIVLNLSKDLLIMEAIYWDYCILKSTVNEKTNYLKFGDYSSAYEGAPIYTCGYPLDLDDSFISTGIISSLRSQKVEKANVILERKVAWLDITTNKGNSGGPLLILGDRPENDKVIGLMSFITTPYFNTLDTLNDFVTEMEKRREEKQDATNFLQYAKRINATVNSNSVGISGCISIEKATNILDGHNK